MSFSYGFNQLSVPNVFKTEDVLAPLSPRTLDFEPPTATEVTLGLDIDKMDLSDLDEVVRNLESSPPPPPPTTYKTVTKIGHMRFPRLISTSVFLNPFSDTQMQPLDNILNIPPLPSPVLPGPQPNLHNTKETTPHLPSNTQFNLGLADPVLVSSSDQDESIIHPKQAGDIEDIARVPFTPHPTRKYIPPTPRRKQTSRACSNCVRAKAGCDQNRPCARCIRLQKLECVDRIVNDGPPNKNKKRIKKRKTTKMDFYEEEEKEYVPVRHSILRPRSSLMTVFGVPTMELPRLHPVPSLRVIDSCKVLAGRFGEQFLNVWQDLIADNEVTPHHLSLLASFYLSCSDGPKDAINRYSIIQRSPRGATAAQNITELRSEVVKPARHAAGGFTNWSFGEIKVAILDKGDKMVDALVEVNESALHILGRSRGAVLDGLSSKLHTMVHESDWPKLLQRVVQVIRGRITEFTDVTHIVHPNGTVINCVTMFRTHLNPKSGSRSLLLCLVPLSS